MDLDDDELKATREFYTKKNECGYCSDRAEYLLHKFGDYILNINGNKLDLRIEGHKGDFFEKTRDDEININYCPMCGRKLV